MVNSALNLSLPSSLLFSRNPLWIRKILQTVGRFPIYPLYIDQPSTASRNVLLTETFATNLLFNVLQRIKPVLQHTVHTSVIRYRLITQFSSVCPLIFQIANIIPKCDWLVEILNIRSHNYQPVQGSKIWHWLTEADNTKQLSQWTCTAHLKANPLAMAQS